jgi:hypothetical protein
MDQEVKYIESASIVGSSFEPEAVAIKTEGEGE